MDGEGRPGEVGMGSGVFVGYGWRMGELEGDKGVGWGGGGEVEGQCFVRDNGEMLWMGMKGAVHC